ncbi:helix-turn-helix domain-containing protein [Lysinibacillus telephonicus]|uniref:XRE family transcriptional regulator n=1 Tax=Lysinibacillus telephonicus TaxID=1714840 RepID=A0A431UQC9_9BACI|nr:helix-turn-helix transcriptional regulator [Lysinibacillus telephonicus]RTQ92258.1 XRE family transcriptional regulator [Lysinibacillus telephonicus]
MELNEAFGYVLRKLRKDAQLSQEDLALRCDLDRTYIGLLERAQRQPTLSTIFKIANVLEIAPSDLIKQVEYHINETLN